MPFEWKSLREPSKVPWRDEGVEWTVEVRWDLVEGWLECVGFSLTQEEADSAMPLTAATLRRFRLGEVVREARTKRYSEMGGDILAAYDAGELSAEISGGFADSLRRELRPLAGRQPGRPKKALGRDHYSEVARIYSQALVEGTPPLQAVVKQKFVSESTASRWVADARKQGLLPPTTPGRAGRPAPIIIEEGH